MFITVINCYTGKKRKERFQGFRSSSMVIEDNLQTKERKKTETSLD